MIEIVKEALGVDTVLDSECTDQGKIIFSFTNPRWPKRLAVGADPIWMGLPRERKIEVLREQVEKLAPI